MAWLFSTGRVLLGLCFVSDGIWNAATFDLRAAYLDQVGAPHFLTWATAAIFILGGGMLIANYKIRMASWPLAAMLLLMSLILLSDPNGTGIGEYPPEFHVEVIFKEWLVHLAIVGTLAFLAAQQPANDHPIPQETTSLTGRVGRAVIGGYFVVNALWQWYYIDIRIEHIEASGGNASFLPVVIGLQIVCGLLVAGGRALWFSTLPLMLVITASTIVVHGNLSATAPYPANLQIHQWFVKAAILAGLIMVLGQQARARRRRAEQVLV